ncbi:hypothetical protein [uncultured Dokdonia sp.]|uniref:hypothetical protein n=1 Tax=uncultured Dokdonia sp. TaxID=575653 RepID=UPI0026126F89|nr:hypothetical protein [uncultured Dokdonia sp.]
MGFGGSVAAANQAMKANRAMLGKHRKGKLSLVSSQNEKWEDPKQPTFEQLMEIRTRIRKEEKVRLKKILIISITTLICIIAGAIYFMNL